MRNSVLGRTLALATLSALLATSVAGCAFTHWTDRSFLGTVGGKPLYKNHVVTGLFVLPIAIAGDVVTAPVQVLLLAFFGDDFLYSAAAREPDLYASAPAPEADTALAALDAQARERLHRQLAERLDRLAAEGRQGSVVFGVNAEGSLIEVALTPEQLRELAARADARSPVCGGMLAHQSLPSP